MDKILKNPVLLHCGAAIGVTLGVSWLNIRPYGVLFIIILAIWIYKERCSTVKIVPPSELSAKLEQFCEKLIILRQDRPPTFYAFTSGTLLALAIIGHIVSGSWIVIAGLIAAALLSTKYQFEVAREEKRVSQAWSSQTTDHDVDEFLPEVNESNLFVLQCASDDAIFSASTTTTIADDDEKSDDVPSELMIPDSIPEIDEHSNSSSEDELLPDTGTLSPSGITKAIPATKLSSDLKFKTGYFKKNSSESSSSEDDSLSKGLIFKEHTAIDGSGVKSDTITGKSSLLQGTDQTMAGLLPSLVSNFVSWQMGSDLIERLTAATTAIPLHAQQAQSTESTSTTPSGAQISKRQRQNSNSSDDSEFEILDSDDFQTS